MGTSSRVGVGGESTQLTAARPRGSKRGLQVGNRVDLLTAARKPHDAQVSWVPRFLSRTHARPCFPLSAGGVGAHS